MLLLQQPAVAVAVVPALQPQLVVQRWELRQLLYRSTTLLLWMWRICCESLQQTQEPQPHPIRTTSCY